MAREICVDLGVVFLPLPDVDIGNMTTDNLHINYTSPIEFEIIKEEGKREFPLMITEQTLKDALLNDALEIKAFNREESLILYADMIRDEFKSCKDEELKNYNCLGNKMYNRSRDEMLRRGLISKEERAERIAKQKGQ